MDKQIEEIAKVIEKTFEVAKRIGAVCPSPRMIATDLNDAGYRKQSKGEWEEYCDVLIDPAVSGFPSVKCSVCGIAFCDIINNHKYMYNFCPNCGADMRGKK